MAPSNAVRRKQEPRAASNGAFGPKLLLSQEHTRA